MQTRTSRHEGDVRQFSIMSQSWYFESNMDPVRRAAGEDEITIGFYCADGGTSGEFSIRWERLNGVLTARLKAFEDSWSALAQFGDVLEKLAALDSTNPDVGTVVEALLRCDVVDATPRVSPYTATKLAPEEIDRLAEVLALFQEALDKIRAMCRKTSGDASWAAGVEYGQQLKRIKGISPELTDEILELAGSVRTKRIRLRGAVSHFPEMAEKYKALLSDSSQ